MPPRQYASTFDRFWSHVDMSAGLTACWPWIGATSRKRSGTRRGNFSIGRLQEGQQRNVMAHRFALALAGGGIDEYNERLEQAAHRCGNILCCNNYSHLYWATAEENVADRVRAAKVAPAQYWSKAWPDDLSAIGHVLEGI